MNKRILKYPSRRIGKTYDRIFMESLRNYLNDIEDFHPRVKKLVSKNSLTQHYDRD